MRDLRHFLLLIYKENWSKPGGVERTRVINSITCLLNGWIIYYRFTFADWTGYKYCRQKLC